MKVLFAVQGTGNGHVSRARDIIPHLQRHAEVDILISGTQVDVSLPQAIKYRKKGVSFVFGKSGGIDYLKTLQGLSPVSLYSDIRSLPLEQYDLLINDFEPVAAWAAKIKKRETIALSHQCSFLSSNTPRPAKIDHFAESIFKYYAPSTSQIGFHFKPYDSFIHTPIIRKEIRDIKPSNLGHYTVYLPAFDDKLLAKYLSKVKGPIWQVFSKHTQTPYVFENVDVQPINNEAFNLSLATCEGLLTGAGFEAPAEALFLGKKVMAIPMKGQYEQYCNAEGLRDLGIPVAYDLDDKFIPLLQDWVSNQPAIHVDFPDNVAKVVDQLFLKYA